MNIVQVPLTKIDEPNIPRIDNKIPEQITCLESPEKQLANIMNIQDRIPKSTTRPY